jgi:phage terminase small subunit
LRDVHTGFGKGFPVHGPRVIDSLFTGSGLSEGDPMQRGRKRDPESVKAARGTAPATSKHPRDEVEADLPRMPTVFPAPAEEIWNDLVVLVERNKLATEKDSQAFANMCQLQAHVTAQFGMYFAGQGEAPAVAAQSELRKQLELFGLAGVRSRVGAAPEKPGGNPFASNGVK